MSENSAHVSTSPKVFLMNAKRGKTSQAQQGSVRIIGGRWRGTRLPVPDRPGLRPTSDRVRETLFNWLQWELPGARVLDLFAGSGALGLEAASRGVAHVQLVEADAGLAAALSAAAVRLGAEETVAVQSGDALAFLRQASAGAEYDIAFVDPPFAAGLWEQVLAVLPGKMAANAWLYLESPAENVPQVPAEWELHRENHTRDVRYALYRRVTLRHPSHSGNQSTT
jgi:16S rRNA (guanine966-N2)-methyltransferase